MIDRLLTLFHVDGGTGPLYLKSINICNSTYLKLR